MSYSAERHRLTRYLARGGAVRREDCGGAVGIVWARVSRTGVFYNKLAGDRLVKRRWFTLDGEKFFLIQDHADAWRAEKVAKPENDMPALRRAKGTDRVA